MTFSGDNGATATAVWTGTVLAVTITSPPGLSVPIKEGRPSDRVKTFDVKPELLALWGAADRICSELDGAPPWSKVNYVFYRLAELYGVVPEPNSCPHAIADR